MIVAAAQLQGCVLLLTEDLQDGAVFGAVTVRSLFTLQARQAAVFAVHHCKLLHHAARQHAREAVRPCTRMENSTET